MKRRYVIGLLVFAAAAAVASGWSYGQGAAVSALGLGALALLGVYIALLGHLGDRYLRYTLVLPTTVLLGVVSVVPIAYLVHLSLRNINMVTFRRGGSFAGLDNYVEVFTRDPLFWSSLLLTVQYVILNLAIQLALGFALALLLSNPFRGRNIVNTALLIPVMTTPIVVATLWKYLLDYNNGGINVLLGRFLGADPVPWLTNRPLPFVESIPVVGPWLTANLNFNYALLAITWVNVWQWTPFVFLLLYAGMQALPQDLYEAARVDGARYWQTVRHITLPLLAPVLSVVVLVRLVDLMKVFDQVWALFGNATFARTLNIHLYTTGLMSQNYGMGAALSVVTFTLSLIISLTYLAIVQRRRRLT